MFDLSKTVITNTVSTRNDVEGLIEHYAKQLLAGKNSLLASGDSNTKLAKNVVRTFGLSLAPSTIAGAGDLCPFASAGCRRSCLYFCGRGGVESVQAGRIARSLLWRNNREWFLGKLCEELESAERSASKAGESIACRLNVLSDIPWERYGIIENFPNVQFYDYSKWPTRFGKLAENYWVTFSLNESNKDHALQVLANAGNVAVCFADRSNPYVGNRAASMQTLPKQWEGFAVVDGDTTDLRYLDTRGRKHGKVIGLRLKALSNASRAEAIASGFAIEHN